MLLAGCGSSSYSSSRGTSPAGGSGTTTGSTGPGDPIGGATAPNGSNDSIVVTPSVAGVFSVIVGAKQTLSITFTSSDGKAVSGFGISGNLTALSGGWSGPSSFACAKVSTGSGCVLNLTYTPTAVTTGSLTLHYVFVDNATIPNTTGSFTINYAATPANNVVTMVSPSGAINASVGGGSQPVAVTFDSDDAHAVTALMLTTDLSTLPAGWSSSAPSFTCASIVTGNGCQLHLTYAPTTLSSGSLTLNYAYTNDAGVAETGSVNLAYAATTNDSVVATPSPMGQINAVVGAAASALAVTFTTDDGRPASALQLTTSLAALPAGWSSTRTTFSCAGVSTGNACQLPLSYAPTAAGGGTLTLAYTYLNNAGDAESGSLNIAYQSTTHDTIVATASQNPISVPISGSGDFTVTFTTSDGALASGFGVTTSFGSLPNGWTSPSSAFTCSAVSTGNTCQLALTYAPVATASGMLTLNYGYTDNAGGAQTGSVSIPYAATPAPHLYVAQLTGTLLLCGLNGDGTLSGCSASGSVAATPTGIAFYGANYAYVADNTANTVWVCSVASSGALSSCISTGSNFSLPWHLAVEGTTLYASDASVTGGVTTCSVSTIDGTLSSCTQSVGTGTAGIAVGPSFAYLGVLPDTIDRCAVSAGGVLSGCAVTSTGFNLLDGITLANGFAYVANEGNATISVCPINAGDGSFATCASSNVGVTPMDVAVDGRHAYVDDATSGHMYLCAISASGALLTPCTISDGGTTFSSSIQIAIH